MARQGISKEQVYTAAAELREEGITPTVQAVRERIGSGSFSTINTHLAEWKTEHAAQAVADIPAMPEKVQEAFARIWATAARSAQEDVETQREALEAMRREMDKERAAMAEEIERLEGELEETTTKAAQLETDLTAERQAGEEKAEQVTALTIEKTRLEEQVKAAQAETRAMRSALDTANTERERDHATHEQDRGRWEKEIEAERSKGEQERTRRAEEREQEKTLRERQQQELERERGAREEAQGQTAELKTENARLEERAGAAEARGSELKIQLETLQEKFAEVAKAQKPKATTKKKAAPARKPQTP
jgi:chromosome segregation ATPase